MEIMEIRDLDKGALDRFHEVATRVYRDDPVWAPGSEMMFTQRFQASRTREGCMVPVVALENGEPLARGVAILATSPVDEAGHRQGWIGFFECLEEYPLAARRVLERCEQILRRAGAKTVLAPKVDKQLSGLLTKGFELPHVVWTNHNPPYYLELFTGYGYEIQTTTCTFYFTRRITAPIDVQLPGFSTREFDRSNLEEEIVHFHELQQAIFGHLSDNISRTLQQDREMVYALLPFLQDELVIFAEDDEGTPVGLLVCLPDMYQALQGQEIDRVRIVSIGAVPRLAHKGIGALMGAHLMKNLVQREEYVFAEGSIVLRSNVPPQNLAKRFHAEPGREFALLAKML
ncbi:hypothetical protein ACFLT5_01845 [Chloroflexota bacterium]